MNMVPPEIGSGGGSASAIGPKSTAAALGGGRGAGGKFPLPPLSSSKSKNASHPASSKKIDHHFMAAGVAGRMPRSNREGPGRARTVRTDNSWRRTQFGGRRVGLAILLPVN